MRCQLRNRTDFLIYCPMFYTWHPKNKRTNTMCSQILVIVFPDYMILHLSLLLYIYCENVEREIYATRPLRDHIGLNVNVIFGVRYTDLRGLPSGILVCTRCPLRPPCAPTIIRIHALGVFNQSMLGFVTRRNKSILRLLSKHFRVSENFPF